MSALALFARTWRRHGLRATIVKSLGRTMGRRVLIEGIDDDFPRPPAPRDLSMPTAADADAWHTGYGGRWKHVLRLPNARMMLHVGAQSVENFFFVGDAWAQLVSRHIAPGSHVMDVGCGCGRTARYNPNGALGCADARFPAADGDVDLVYAASLFTHLYPDDTRAYAREMHRVLADGGIAVVSFHDRPEAGGGFSGDEHRADYDADAFRRIFAEACLDLAEDVGDVCGQHTLVLRKRGG